MEKETQWSTTKCLRVLRPLKVKISSLKGQLHTIRSEPIDNEGDISMDQSLILDEHVISYTRAKQNYKKTDMKRRKILDDDWIEEDEEVSVLDLPTNTWEKKRKSMDWETWGIQNDIFELVRSILIPMGHRSTLKLSQICALEIGIHVGLNSNEFSKTVEERKVAEFEGYVKNWYEGPATTNYKSWLMYGHCIGIIFSNCELLKDVILFIIEWSKELGLQKVMGELYLEMIDKNELWNREEEIREVYSLLGLEFEIMLLKYLRSKVINIGKKTMTEVYMILIRIHHVHYEECLDILSVLIDENCHSLAVTPKLVESFGDLNSDQRSIIEHISLFINIINLNKPKCNNTFLKSAYKSCKNGYRSLIPILKIIRDLVNDDLKPPLKLTTEQKHIIRQIFKPHCRLTRTVLQLIGIKSDMKLISSTLPSTKRSRVSTGDLI